MPRQSVRLDQCKITNGTPLPKLVGTKNGSGVWQKIISEMPPHRVYIEPFWGRGSIARHKRPAECTVGCDLDPDAVKSGVGLGTVFQADALPWLRSYFHITGHVVADSVTRSTAATFAGAPWREHFVYLDPPYLIERSYYDHTLTAEQHAELLEIFWALPCPAALSGYASPLYDSRLRAARRIAIDTGNRSGKKVREYLWLNYPPPELLHDARFVGSGRRERERIRRRVRNWQRFYRGMKPMEQQAVLEGLLSAGDAVERVPGSRPPRVPPD